MKRISNLFLSTILVGSIQTISTGSFAANGAINGGCYNLQLIASPDKNVSMTDSNRHTIFLPLNRAGSTNAKINLTEGEFKVLDGNGTDGVAAFQLPNPDPTLSGSYIYQIYARMVGKPGSGMDLSTCTEDSTGAVYCYNTLSLKRQAGSSKFTNVSKELLTFAADLNGDGIVDSSESFTLFSNDLYEYFWDVDSYGRAHAQLKFCPVKK